MTAALRRSPRALTAVLLVCAAGCAIQPPNSVALAFYMRNLSDEQHWYRIVGDHPQPAPFVGEVVEGPASTGCGFVGPDWQLVVTKGESLPQPADDFVVHVTADDFGNRDPVVVSLTIEDDGSASVEQGVPEWWGDRDIQVCPNE